ncbi:MAG: FmdB family zinc ribbon protein [Kiloniellaceae bacterium]
MPLYNYVCEGCGEFDAWGSMSECEKPARCPTCGHRSRRAVSAPALALMNGANRKAHQINERSADEPKVVEVPDGGSPFKRGHRHGHGHGHGGKKHWHVSPRPWMVGH